MANKTKLVELFKKVQKIPYKVCPYNENKIDEKLAYGDCRHKSFLLKKLLEEQGFEVKRCKVIFDWSDLPLPKKILNILKSGRKFPHNILKVKIGKKWIKVDCNWQIALKDKGFPVTEDWDGKSDTKQITKGKLIFFDNNGDYINHIKEKKDVNTSTEEAYKFYTALDKFLKENCS